MKIENSARLSYHFIDANDNDFLFLLDQNPNVMKYISGGKPTSKDDIKTLFIPRIYAYRNANKGWGLWKVTVIDSQEDIGWILVRPMEFFSDAPNFNDIELGWRFIQSSWGKGYATESAKHIQHILGSGSNNQYFSAIAVEENIASISVMKKIGMQYVKTYLHTDSQMGDLQVVHYQMKNR